jgi:hypothetical protein
MNGTGKLAGLVLRVDGVLRFVPASIALSVAPPPRLTPVPGAPPALVGIALHQGAVVPVVAIGSTRGEMIVCQHAGELVGLVGGEMVRSGSFDAVAEQPEMVAYEGRRVETLDVAAIYASVQTSARSERWGG